MASNDQYVLYHGLFLPKIVHTEDSLKYFESFQMQDDDVLAVTYPKSGKWLKRLSGKSVCWKDVWSLYQKISTNEHD